MKQTSFGSAAYAGKKRQTRRERFLAKMNAVVPWSRLEALEDALYDSQAMREFIGIDLGRENVPDATTLLKFRRLLEQHDLTAAILADVNAHLTERGLMMRQGVVADATIIAAPSSTKNEDGKRDPRDAPDPEGRPVAFRHEDALGRGRRAGPDPQRCLHGGA